VQKLFDTQTVASSWIGEVFRMFKVPGYQSHRGQPRNSLSVRLSSSFVNFAQYRRNVHDHGLAMDDTPVHWLQMSAQYLTCGYIYTLHICYMYI